MGTLGEWFKKYNNYTPGNQNNSNNAVKQNPSTNQSGNTTLAAWFEKYNNYTPSGADTVQPPAGTEAVVPSTQPSGYKSQNAAHLSSGLSRDDFDSSVRNRNQLRALEAQQKNINPPENSPTTPATLLESVRPTQTTPTTPYFSYGTNKPSSLAEAEKYIQDTSKTMVVLSSEIEFGNSTLGARENKINDYISRLENLAQEMQNNPTAQKYSAYNTLYDEYQKYYAEYESFLSEHNAKIGLYNDYAKRYETAGNIYNTEKQQYYDKWKSSVRSIDRAGTEEIDREISETEKKFLAAMSPAEKSKYGEKLQRLTEEKYYSDYLYYQGNMRSTSEILSDIAEAQKGPLGPNEKKIKALEKELSFTYDLIPTLEGFRDNGAGAPGFTFYMPPYVEGDADVPASYYNTFDPESKDAYRQMTTAEERGIFQYLLKTEGEEAAEAYMERMKGTLKNRLAGEVTEPYREYANNHPILSSIESVIIAPAKAFSYVGQLKDFILDGEIDETAAYNLPSMAQTSIRNEVSKDMNTAESFFYQTGMSVGDFLFTTAASGGFAGGGAVSEGISLILMGGGAAADTVIAAKNNGRSDKEAILLGTAAGVIETVTEKIGYDALFDSALRGESVVRYLLKNSLSESAEEGTSKLLNTFADFLISGVMGTETDIQRQIKELVSNGYTYSEATGIVYADWAAEFALDTLGGALSGFAMSGGSVAIDKTSNAVGQKMDVQTQIREQEQTIKNADAVIGAYAEAVQKYGENSPQAMELKSKAERAYIEKVRANLRLGMLNGKSTTVTTQERSEEEITQLVTQAQAAGDATAETGYYAGASDQLIKFAQQEKAILKQLTGRNVDIRFYQADVGENGHYDPETGTIYVNVNSERPFSYIEGHEFTHELENSAGYAEYAEWVKTEGLGAMYNTYKENIKKRYEDRGINLTELELEQEVVATWTGENLFTDDTTMKKLIKKLSDGKPTLARKIFGGIRRFVSRSRSGITRNHYERALYLYQQMAQGKSSPVSSAQTVNENVPTSFPAETAKASQKQKNTAEAVNTAENDIMISNGEAVAQYNGKIANDSEFTPAVRELVDRIADTARQIEASDQKGTDYRRLKKEQKANLRALEQLRREGKIDSVEYNRAIETLRDTTEGPEYGGIEESKANLQAQFEAGEISQEDYESAMAELDEVGAEETPGRIKYSIVNLEDGKLYVEADRKIINGTTRAEQRKEITEFFSRLLDGNPTLDIPTIEGDVLTITKAETATKARDDYKSVDGKRIKLSDEEFLVKLHVESHIDEVTEISTKQDGKDDGKNHSFAKDGFTYRKAYFKDFDGQYYEVTLSIGNNGTVATVYSVGKIKESVLPSAKILAVVGSKPLGKTPSGIIVSHPGQNVNNKNSISSDSNGKALTSEQSEYFKHSKIVDDNGNLKVMHHGSPETFTIFDRSKAKASGYYGRGFYFTDSDSHAKQYGNTYDVYLNITNPIKDGTKNITKEQLRKFVEAVAENEDYGIDNYGYGATVDSVTDSVYGKSDFAMLMDVNASCVGDMVAAIELFNEVNGTDYNGIITPTETVAFYPEQIKLVTNQTPTSDKDIRFSLEDPTREDVISELRQYMSGARSKDQIRDVIAKVKKNPQSEIYGGPARRPQYSEGVQKILADAEREGMSVRDYISQNIDEFEVRGKLTEDARKALEISGDYRKFSVEDVRASRPPRSIEELDRILAEAEPLDPNEFRKTDFDRWYERREKEDQLREKMAELVMKSPDENEINTTLEELASDLENGYITPDAALEVVEGLREETDGARVKYSLEKYTEHQKENWANSKRIVIYENDAQFTQFIENSVSDKTFDKKMYFGAISPELARRIQNDTGINVEHYNLSLSSNEIRKILKKHGNAESEALSGQRAVTTDDFLHILDVVLNPDNIKLSDQTYAGKPVIIFTGTYNGQMNIVAVVSDKRLDLFVQTVYVNTKRGTLATPIGETILYHTPEANSGTDSSARIVPQDPDVVKPTGKKSLEDNWTAEEKEFLEELSRQRAESGDVLDYQAANQEDFYAYLRQEQKDLAEFDAENRRRTAEKALSQRRANEANFLEALANERKELDALDAENERQKAEEARAIREANEADFLEALANERKELDALDAENERQKAEEARAIREANEADFLEALNEQRKDLDRLDNIVQKDGEGEETELQEEIRSNAMDRYLQLGDAAAIYVTDLGKSSDSTSKVYEYFFSPHVIESLKKKYRMTNPREAAEVYKTSRSLASKAAVKEKVLELTEEDKALAREILCGERRIFEISDRPHRDEFLEYIALLGEREIMAEAWRNWRVERRNQWQKEADGMYQMFDSSVKGGDFKRDKNDNIKLHKKKGTAKLEKDGTDRAGYKYARETQTRITYDIFADDKFAEAKAFNDWLFAPERASEAQSNRYKNKMRDRVRKMNLDLKVKKGDTLSEAAAVQLVGELQDIIRRTKRQAQLGNDKYKVNGLTYKEAVENLAHVKGHNPSMDFSPKGKIQNAITEFTDIYAEILSDMNEVLVRNGYPPVFARSGYFPHFADEGDTLIRRIGRALGIDTDVSVLPTGINGLTHTFKPGKTWFANALERKGPRTAYDAVLGFDKYIEGAANVIFHTDNIQRQRAFARAIRYNESNNVIQKRILEVNNDETMNDDEKDLQIQYLTSQAKFRHSAYVVQLEDHTNSLAGKKTFSDRDMEKLLGRKAYTWMKNIEGRTAANMIAANLSSAFSNSIPLRYCVAEMGEWQTLRAMVQTIKSYHTDDGFVDRSDFLTNRYGSKFLVKSGMDKISETLSIPMEAIDHFTAQVLVRAAYNKYSKKGASPELAMERANSFAAGVMADRSRGALPEIFNNKSPIYKAFTMFQVEVNNNISHILKDIPREYRDENKAKWISAVTWILARLFFGIWCFNETAEKIFGRRMAGTDVIDAANNLVGDIIGYQYPNGWDILEAKLEGENIRDLFKTDRENVGQTIWNLGVTAAEEMPFLSSFFGGGELPVASARPDFSKLLPTIGSDKDPMNIAQTWIEEFGRPVSYMLLPFGANQASKMLKGGSVLLKGGSYKTNSKGEEILQYPIYSDNVAETAWDHLRTVLLGKSSTDQSREWVDSGFKSLSARGTAAYKGMIAAGVDEYDAHSLIIDIMSVEPTDQEIEEKIVSMGGVDRVFTETVEDGPSSTELKCEIIRNADISNEGKAILYFAMIANESECNFMSSMQEAGADMGAVVAELLDKKTGSDAHKYSAIMSSGLPEAEQLWQIYLLDTSAEKSTHKRYYVASDTFGISPNEYRVANDFLTNYLDGNSKTNERVTAAVREYAETVPLTKTEKAVLWQLLSKSTSAKNNPFDVRTGERVLTAINNYDREEEEFYAKYGPQPVN